MEADNLDYGFNGNLGGVSLGADYTFENAIRAGITFNIGGGYAESSGGDLNSTENRMSFWGLGAYAGWNYENFGLMADVSYTSTWNDLKQDMDSRMGMGDLEATCRPVPSPPVCVPNTSLRPACWTSSRISACAT